MDMFQSFDSTTSAGYLDGFGIGHDGYTGNSLPNEIINTNEMPHGMPSRRIQVQHTFNYSNAKDHLAVAAFFRADLDTGFLTTASIGRATSEAAVPSTVWLRVDNMMRGTSLLTNNDMVVKKEVLFASC